MKKGKKEGKNRGEEGTTHGGGGPHIHTYANNTNETILSRFFPVENQTLQILNVKLNFCILLFYHIIIIHLRLVRVEFLGLKLGGEESR